MRTFTWHVYGTWNEDVQKAFQVAWMAHRGVTLGVTEVGGLLVAWTSSGVKPTSYIARIEVNPKLQKLSPGAVSIQGLLEPGPYEGAPSLNGRVPAGPKEC
jgi:hypothetical protein